MGLVETFLRLAAAADVLLGGECDVVAMDLDRDWSDVERLLRREEWPFVRADLEVGHAQPGAVCHVARVDGRFAGYFTTHPFGDVGYLDMMIVDTAFRGRTVARPLYLRTLTALQAGGTRGLVVHTTNDSARLVRLLGFSPGLEFTLSVRPAGTGGAPIERVTDRDGLVARDAEVFGARRASWIDALLAQPEVQFVTASGALACLRPRAHGALCLDAVASRDDDSLRSLVDAVVATFGDRELHCFARTDGALDQHLRRHGFVVPAFFVPIGPLVEWRQGDTGAIGLGERVQSLMWL